MIVRLQKDSAVVNACHVFKESYFVRGIYVLTSNVNINIARVHARETLGGHGVLEEKIRLR